MNTIMMKLKDDLRFFHIIKRKYYLNVEKKSKSKVLGNIDKKNVK